MEKKVISTILETIVPGQEAKDAEIYFEALSMSSLEEMHAYSINEKLYEFFEFDAFKTIDDTRRYLKELFKRMHDHGEGRKACYWFVRRKSDNRLIGTGTIVNINYARKSLEWGYAVDPELWGTGYILSIQELLKEYIFDVLNFNRIYGQTMTTNKRTISSLLACGMIKEGILRDFYCKKGVFIDGWSYSMLQEDYLKSLKTNNNLNNQITIKGIIKIISTVLEDDQINEKSTMYNTTNWDSLNQMSIMVALFEKTKIKLTPIQISNATSVEVIEQLLNGKMVTE